MNEETKELLKVLGHAHAKIVALEAMVQLLAGMEAQRNPIMVAMLKRMASGDVPNPVPNGPAIYFKRSDGTGIKNFPGQHYNNCASKHQATSQWFKPTVRIFKNMRNRLIEDGALAKGVAPPYFIEGMLWNVPKELFGASY